MSRLARSRWFRPRAFHGTRANLKWFLVRHLSAINVPLLVMNVPHEDIACRPCGRNGCGRLLASVSEQYSELGQIASTTHIEGQIGIRNLAVIWLGLCPCLDRKIFERVGDCMCAGATAYAVTGFGKFWRIEAVAALSVRPSLRLVSFLYFRWRCSARFARTSIFLHLHSWASAAAPAFPRAAHPFLPPPTYHHACMDSCTTTFSPPHNPLRRPVNSNVRGPLDVLYGFRGDVCVWSVLRRRGRQHEGAGRVREGKSPKPVFAWHCAALVGFASTTAVLERH